MAKIIDSIDLPQGLKGLDLAELIQVTSELRDELIDTVATAGGHLASSLGAAELSVALHYVFATPEDRLIWDVGHQAYIHKMLTGRRCHLASIRQSGGISGFPRRDESEYDTFGTGHAGTSISAAVGMCIAAKQTGSPRYVVPVIGDGSMTSGMCFEALNHAGDLELTNLIVVLNDNEMSISPNVGAIKWLFSRALTSHVSTKARLTVKSMYQQGFIPKLVYKALDRAEGATQSFISGPAMLFESFGFRYIGPVDGHNLEELIRALENAREQKVPVLVHSFTVKGKGYHPAEENPIKWHGVMPFNRRNGEFLPPTEKKADPPSYTAVFGQSLARLAARDPRIIGITAAMAQGTGLDKLQAERPQQFFDVGICEEHAVTLAAGLACEGLRPVCAIYSTFLQRAFDQIAHDVCIQKLPVLFAMDRAGVVGNDGETHQGVFDIAYLRTLPHMVIMSPKDEDELQHMLFTGLHHDGPVALRYPRGSGCGVPLEAEAQLLPIGKAEILQRGTDLLLIAFGPMVQQAVTAARVLHERHNLSTTIINARFAKPLDRELLVEELPRYPLVCTIEDHALMGGFGSAVLELAQDEGLQLKNTIKRFGVGDAFVPHASQTEQRRRQRYDAAALVEFVADLFRSANAVGA